MYKQFLFLLFSCGAAAAAFGQGVDEEALVQGQIVYELIGEGIEVRGLCENRTDERIAIAYDFKVSGEDKSNNPFSGQKDGEAVLAALETKTVSTTKLPISGLSRFEVILELYYQDVLIDADTLVYSADQEEGKREDEFKEDISEEVDFEGQDSGLEFGGLIIDNTRTRAGRDFYDMLYSLWEAPAGAGDYLIKIEEFPGRVRTTRLVVWLDEEKIVDTNLQPNYDYIEGLAGYTNSRLQGMLSQRAEAGKNLNDELSDIY